MHINIHGLRSTSASILDHRMPTEGAHHLRFFDVRIGAVRVSWIAQDEGGGFK